MEPGPSSSQTSLLKRLAGPSSTKAGCVPSPAQSWSRVASNIRILKRDRLSKDQTEINRIIADVSKGSKFYEAGTLL